MLALVLPASVNSARASRFARGLERLSSDLIDRRTEDDDVGRTNAGGKIGRELVDGAEGLRPRERFGIAADADDVPRRGPGLGREADRTPNQPNADNRERVKEHEGIVGASFAMVSRADLCSR